MSNDIFLAVVVLMAVVLGFIVGALVGGRLVIKIDYGTAKDEVPQKVRMKEPDNEKAIKFSSNQYQREKEDELGTTDGG